MAEQTNNNGNAELDRIALEIYARGSQHTGRGSEQDALLAYQRAEAFLAIKDKVRGGLLKAKAVAPVLADCHAPNLKKTHPHNLVSQAAGNVDTVKRLAKWLSSNPTPEGDPQELVDKLNSEFPALDWKLPEINVARAIFPVYAKN